MCDEVYEEALDTAGADHSIDSSSTQTYYSRSIDFNSGTQTATNETSEHLSQVTSHDGPMTEIQKKVKSNRGFFSIFNEKKFRIVFSPHKKL